MTDTRFAPPKAELENLAEAQQAPVLWNPNAAVNWSLLFSPAFGAFLHMKNWQALGQPQKASAAKAWVIVSLSLDIGFAVVSAAIPDSKELDILSRGVAVLLLLSWYFVSARAQAKYVKRTLGADYPRKAWAKPLLIGFAAIVTFMAAIFLIVFFVTLR